MDVQILFTWKPKKKKIGSKKKKKVGTFIFLTRRLNYIRMNEQLTAIFAAPTICSAVTVVVVIAWITAVLLQCSKKASRKMALLLHLFSVFQINGLYFTKHIIHQQRRKKDKAVNRFHYHQG